MTAHRVSSDDTSIGRSMPAGQASRGSAADSNRTACVMDVDGSRAFPREPQQTARRPVGAVAPAPLDTPTEVRPAPLDAPTMIIGRSDNPTTLMAAVRQQSPVFVDPSGRRLSRLRLLAYVAGLLGLIYTGLVGISFAGVVEPHTVLPFVDEVKQPERPVPQTEATLAVPDPSTAVPRTPAVTTAPTVVPAPPRSAAPTRSPSVTRPPAATMPPSRAPASRPTPSRPVPTAPETIAPTVTAPTEDPPLAPDELPEQAVGLRVDG